MFTLTNKPYSDFVEDWGIETSVYSKRISHSSYATLVLVSTGQCWHCCMVDFPKGARTGRWLQAPNNGHVCVVQLPPASRAWRPTSHYRTSTNLVPRVNIPPATTYSCEHWSVNSTPHSSKQLVMFVYSSGSCTTRRSTTLRFGLLMTRLAIVLLLHKATNLRIINVTVHLSQAMVT